MSEEIITVWKATKANGQPTYGSRALPQPGNGKPGAWHDVGRYPVLCAVGVHGCRTLVDMLRGGWLDEELYVAELRGPLVDSNSKVAARSGRLCYKVDAWNEQTARLFAADCAEMVAHLHPIIEPTVRVVRRYTFGLASVEDLAAALDAVWAAERAAERAAALTARAATIVVVWAAEGAAAYAARGAACAARGAAYEAGDAAMDAAYKRMALRLHDYLTNKVDIEAIRRGVE